MTRPHKVILTITGLALALIATALLKGQSAPRLPKEIRMRSVHGSGTVPVVEGEVMESLMAILVKEAPFRWSRRSLGTAAASSPAPGMPAPGAGADPAPPKPNLVLAGIVWGREPLAVLEGVPGSSEPRVVLAGDSVGGLRIRSVTRDRVVIVGFDTVWTLQLKARWQ